MQRWILITKDQKKKVESVLEIILNPNGFQSKFPEANTPIDNHIVNVNYLHGLHSVKGLMKTQKETLGEAISRYMARYHGAIHNESTRKLYMRYFPEFLEFSGINHIELVETGEERRQWMLEKWVLDLASKKCRKEGIRTRLAAVEKFLKANRCKYFPEALHYLIPENESDEIGGWVAITDEEIRQLLKYCRTLRTRLLIHFYKDTGARTNAICDPVLRLKHVHKMPDGCYAIKIYNRSNSESSRSGYYGFLTFEGGRAFEAYLDYRKANGEVLGPESPLFRSASKKHDHLTVLDVYRIFRELYDQVGIKRNKIDDGRYSRFDKSIVYCYRKRFYNICVRQENIKPVVIDRLMNHKGQLSERYYRPTRDELYLEYKKLIRNLTVGEEEKLRLNLEEKNKRLSELEVKEEQRKQLVDEVEKLKRALVEKVLKDQESTDKKTEDKV